MIYGFALVRRRTLLGALACLAAAGLAIPTTAGAAKVTKLTSCQDISSPGRYRLAANVTTSESYCFDISANHVTLKLDRHTITGLGRAAFGIAVYGVSGKIVGPGTVSNFMGAGIDLEGGHDPGEGSSVRRVTATGNVDGIAIDSPGNHVLGNVATDNQFFGIGTSSFDALSEAIIGNFAHGNGNFDLFEVLPDCGNNLWADNDFGTANKSCIH